MSWWFKISRWCSRTFLPDTGDDVAEALYEYLVTSDAADVHRQQPHDGFTRMDSASHVDSVGWSSKRRAEEERSCRKERLFSATLSCVDVLMLLCGLNEQFSRLKKLRWWFISEYHAELSSRFLLMNSSDPCIRLAEQVYKHGALFFPAISPLFLWPLQNPS